MKHHWCSLAHEGQKKYTIHNRRRPENIPSQWWSKGRQLTPATRQAVNTITKAMPNWIFVKRQLKFDKPRYLFTKHTNWKRKHNYFTTKQCIINICIYYIHFVEKDIITAESYETMVLISYEMNTFSMT